MKNTNIEWADHTFNPWWGCTEVSPACDHCYARTFANRLGFSIWGQDSPRRLLTDGNWNQPALWDRSARNAYRVDTVFCGSMCDILEQRPELHAVRLRLLDTIAATPNLRWLLLTKRPQNFERMMPWLRDASARICVMTTVETPQYYWRIAALTRFAEGTRLKVGLSCEPLLAALTDIPLDGVNWVIAGGESGSGSRPVRLSWLRELRDDCQRARVPFFFKQWGSQHPHRTLDGREWSETPWDGREGLRASA